jgi:hypothetical protein
MSRTLRYDWSVLDLAPKIRAIVLTRDLYSCFCCGESVLDRPYTIWRRNPAHGDSPANLITILGTPSTGCLERLERREPPDEANGYVLRTGQDPERQPALMHGHLPLWLTADGGYRTVVVPASR